MKNRKTDYAENSTKLLYNKPAQKWSEALPIGNGRLGGMIYGKVIEEQVQLNEDTVYYGGPRDRNNPFAQEYFPKIRDLLKQGKLAEAQELARVSMTGTPRYTCPYQPLSDLFLRFSAHQGNATDYQRELDLANAIVRVNYVMNDRMYTREYFSSAIDQVDVIRIACNGRGMVSVDVNLMRRPFDPGAKVLENNRIMMKGKCGEDGIEYCVMAQAIIEGQGQVKAVGDCIRVEKADAVIVFIAAQTSFRYDNPQLVCEEQLSLAKIKGYSQILNDHIADYQYLYRRMELRLGEKHTEDQKPPAPTDQRLERLKDGEEDLSLITLFFNYGRYLLISCSRPGTMPANLQGIWNDQFAPAWESIFTININLEMNYWPAEVCNLSECHQPLFDLLERMREPGRRTAREMYGCKGLVAHHNTNLWADTAPTGAFPYIWPMGAAWLCTHLWEHYLYTGDKGFLASKAYPIMKESVEFFLDYLVEDDNGYLITGLSQSPENAYRLPNGEVGSLCSAPAMDSQILHELFESCIHAGKILGYGDEFLVRTKEAVKRLPPLKIGSRRQILEWDREYEEVEPGHRHMSHLFALHPGNQISLRQTPELAKAARNTLEYRLANGGGHTGWSRAWLIIFWARLEEGDKCYENILMLLTKSTLPNLFDNHPPFQIDGNFGATAAIAEMLMQSHEKEIHLLPALPTSWRLGEVKGIRARGGFEIDMKWNDGAPTCVRIYSHLGNSCKVRIRQSVENVVESDTGNSIEFKQISPDVILFDTKISKAYDLILSGCKK